MQTSQRAAFAESTRNDLRTQLNSYFEFCNYFNIEPLPVFVQNICMHAQYLSRLTAVSYYIKNFLNAVRMLHVFNGYEYSHHDSAVLKLVIKGIVRFNLHFEKEHSQFHHHNLLDIHININLQNVNGVMFWCLYLFSFL